MSLAKSGGKKKAPRRVGDLEKLEKLIQLIFEDLQHEGGRFKVGDLIKTLELKRKLAPPDDKSRTFWEMIEKIRAEELPDSAAKNSGLAPAGGSKGRRPVALSKAKAGSSPGARKAVGGSK